MKTLLLTGGTRGIGKGIAEYFLNKGWRVILLYKSCEENAKKLCENENCYAYRVDIRNEEEINAVISHIKGTYGEIDCLINNAGVAKAELVQDTSTYDYDLIFDTNVKGTFLMTKGVVPLMISKKRGTIINISSMWGISGGSFESVYSASKAAVIGFTKALAKELGPSGIRVNAIAPGVIKTDMTASLSEDDINALKEETPLLRCGEPLDVAKVAYFLANDDSSFITGQVISVDGGIII